METNKRKAIIKPIIQATIIMVIFYVIEIAMVWLNTFSDN